MTEEVQAKRRAPNVVWKTDRSLDLRCLVESTTYEGGPLAENDLLNIELCNDNLKMFDMAWEVALMVMHVELDMGLMDGLYFRQLEKSTLMMSALALYHPDQVQESTIYTKLKTMVTDLVYDQQQDSFTSHKEKDRVKDKQPQSILPKQCDEKKGDCKQWTSQGSCSRGASWAIQSTMTKIEARAKEVNDSEHQVRQTVNSSLQKPEVSNKTGTSPSGRDDRLSCYSNNEKKKRVA